MSRIAIPALGRRAFLQALGVAGGVVAAPGLWDPAPAMAKAPSKVRRVDASKLGVTMKLELSHAPFPCDGSPYQDATVMVFVPAHYRAPENDELDLVVHFHGHLTTAERAMAAHKLREQLHESKQNAVLVVPQGAVNAAESPPGKLEKRGGLRRLCGEVAAALSSPSARRALGDSAIPRRAKLGVLCLSAHSGGYRVAAACLRHGGCNVNEVYLFDALYGEVDAFRDWVLARKGKSGRDRHKLISHFVGGAVRRHNLELERALEARGVKCLHERRPGELTRAQLLTGRAIFIEAPVAHGAVTFQQNAFRDCLFASCLRRQLRSGWFKKKNEPRKIDVRTST
ncbi:hypothetical protein SOCEGT47_083730 [Sorangium cellulosum]|uniref:Alpha/beta hydrolase n=1 Tax=Sorangium cellulosum TaxID=56 RepID=A0A4P2QDE8_SORCE|nr:hypothetical protein [Sorangium cellulosum]AUX27775.1 hypothetical protein SOCEGT47_083730 [Sorangium cellulosum]